MGIFHRSKKKPARRYVADFMDYESKGITPQRFGDTRPQYTSEKQNYEELNNLYRKNGIVHKIVSKPAKDATRNGWRLIIPDNPTKQADYQKALDDLDLKKMLAQELIYERLHGDGYVTLGVMENSKTSNYDPLDPNNIKQVIFVHPFGEEHVQKIETNNDPTSNDYLKESKLKLNPTKTDDDVDKNGNVVSKMQKLDPIVIDATRYFHISLDKMEDDTTGNSIVTRCFDQIKTLDTALYSVGKMLYEYTFKVLYSNRIYGESDADFKKEYYELAQGMSTEGLGVFTEDERLDKLSTNPSGIQNLLDFAWQNLSAASNIPKSVLTGEQSGTLAGASQDVVNYYDGIKAMQEEILRPQIEHIVELIMYSSAIGGGPEDPDNLDWKIEFNPLQSPDDKTQSETLVNYVNAASTLVGAGIKSPDEAAQMLAGQNNNNVTGMQDKTDSKQDIDPKKIDKLESKIKEALHGGKTKQ